MTVEFENCDKTIRFKDSDPAKYRELLQDLAALEDCRAKKKDLVNIESYFLPTIHLTPTKSYLSVPTTARTRKISGNF